MFGNLVKIHYVFKFKEMEINEAVYNEFTLLKKLIGYHLWN